ncbi:glycosyltransferase family 2 protein [Allorhizobium pseudoryzae]|uniref:glycosyltransferase family 2 protein n=1 Tax=Allorhizobium pseudoryzae TaxID=379684 RepID=UPI003CFF6EAF
MNVREESAAERAMTMRACCLLMERGSLNPDDMAKILGKWTGGGYRMERLLISERLVSARSYYQALAEANDLPFIDLTQEPCDPALLKAGDRNDYTRLSLLPWRRQDGVTLIATTELGEAQRHWAIERFGKRGFAFLLTSSFDILWETQRQFRESDDRTAREDLCNTRPLLSARTTFTKAQALVLAVLFLLTTAALIVSPHATLMVAGVVVTVLYTASFVFKFILTLLGANSAVDTAMDIRAFAEDLPAETLPIYSVLVPMYREARVLPLLVRALERLDYPASKLDIKLVLEEDDIDTIEAAKAMRLPATFEIVRVPASQPRTKPKACNYALPFCRGEFVTIYDAEDQPEPDQLRLAVAAFRLGQADLACVQARLNYFNRSENWLTRMFTLEYSQWFDFFLPALSRMSVPIPLGGTSNHFRIDVLRQAGAWDPFNVTEDADLGVRLAQSGYSVGVIPSTTFEEATSDIRSWVKQRSRWIKGYMQTWLVHMRNPVQLWRSLGTAGFLSFQAFIGLPPFTVLINPILWLMTLLFAASAFGVTDWTLPQPFGALALFNLIIGNLLLLYFGTIACLKRGFYDLMPSGLLMPLYWVLHSVAAYKALWQLINTPHHWEKTEHGKSEISAQLLARAAA